MDLKPDKLAGGLLQIYQPPHSQKVTMDTVLLAGFVRPRGAVLELGSGSGAVSLLVAYRGATAVEGIEIDEVCVEAANAAAILNNLPCSFRLADLRAPDSICAGAYQTLVFNPPYENPGQGVVSPVGSRAAARQGSEGTLEDFVRAASRALEYRGRAFMVVRTPRLPDALGCCRQAGLEPCVLVPVYDRPGKKAYAFLLQARKGGKGGFELWPALYLRDEQGEYTSRFLSFYEREGPSWP